MNGTVTQVSGDYWDSVAAEWMVKGRDSLWRKHSDSVNSTLFSRWMARERYDRVLKTDLFDEAVSAGLLPVIRRGCRSVVGMDISGPVAAEADRRLRIPALSADVRALPFPDRTFDVIISNSTLDHFRDFADIVRALGEFHRVLRKSGELWITLDNASNPLVAVRNALPFGLLNRVGLVPYYVGATCGRTKFQRTLQEAGFEVGEIGAVLHCVRALSVGLTRVAERYGSPAMQRGVLRFLQRFERAANWPTRYRTGYFLAARAIKRGPCPAAP